MEKEFVNLTRHSEYTDSCPAEYKEYYQLHIFSHSQILSTYYHQSFFKFSDIKDNAERVLKSIQRKTRLTKEVSLIENEGILLISASKKFLNYMELFEFDIEQGCYEYVDSGMDFFDFLGEIPADIFIKNALTTVGAESLYPIVKPHVDNMLKEQVRLRSRLEELRQLDKTAPKYLIEIYYIKKNYIPLKTHEFFCGSMESPVLLPEIRNLYYGNERVTYIAKDLATGKVIDGSIAQAIESIKHNKWLKKHPGVMDPEVMRRMELDNDDPDFICFDDYFGGDVEYEEGDEEYKPRF